MMGEPVSPLITYRAVDRDGRTKWLQFSTVTISWEGRNAGLALAIDITEQRKMEQALRESEERFRRLSEATSEGILFHRDGEILDANQAFADMTQHELSPYHRNEYA